MESDPIRDVSTPFQIVRSGAQSFRLSAISVF
jgi:hypothetical protein